MTEMIQISQNEQIWHFPSDWIWTKEMLIQQYSMEKKSNYAKDNLDECEHDSKETNNIENIITKLKHHTENCPN